MSSQIVIETNQFGETQVFATPDIVALKPQIVTIDYSVMDGGSDLEELEHLVEMEKAVNPEVREVERGKARFIPDDEIPEKIEWLKED